MRVRHRCAALVVLLVVLGASRESSAAPVTFSFSGSVTAVPVDEPGTGIVFGDPIIGTFTFESTTVDLIAAAGSGSYHGSGLPLGITVMVGGFVYATNDFLAISIANDFPQDQYAVLGCLVDSSCGSDLQIELFLEDLDGTVFGGDALPLASPAIGSFEIRDFHLLAIVGGNQLQVDGTIDDLTCLTCVPVPEPATWLLLAPALGAWRWQRRHRSARNR